MADGASLVPGQLDDLEDVTQVPGQLDIYGNEIGTPDPSWAEHFDIAEGTEP